MNTDTLIEEMAREQRHRQILVIAAVIGIIASAVGGIGFALGGFAADGATGPRNPGGLVFFVMPFAVAMLIGGGIFQLVRFIDRRRSRRAR